MNAECNFDELSKADKKRFERDFRTSPFAVVFKSDHGKDQSVSFYDSLIEGEDTCAEMYERCLIGMDGMFTFFDYTPDGEMWILCSPKCSKSFISDRLESSDNAIRFYSIPLPRDIEFVETFDDLTESDAWDRIESYIRHHIAPPRKKS